MDSKCCKCQQNTGNYKIRKWVLISLVTLQSTFGSGLWNDQISATYIPIEITNRQARIFQIDFWRASREMFYYRKQRRQNGREKPVKNQKRKRGRGYRNNHKKSQTPEFK